MRLPRLTRHIWTMLIGVTLASVLALVFAIYPANSWLQLGPVFALLAAAPWLLARWPLSDRAVACLAVFLLLHAVGAAWSYSFVPYDDAARRAFGSAPADWFGWNRNHYDRLVHLAFGLLLLPPLAEALRRHRGYPRRAALWSAFVTILALSAAYEVFEWLLGIALSPDSTDAYNGQQGDVWDAQKDMALAMLGAGIFMAAERLARLRR